MNHQLLTDAHPVVSNTDGLSCIRPEPKDIVSADIGFRVVRRSSNQLDFNLYGPLIDDPDANVFGLSTRSEHDIFEKVERCREVWTSNVVQYKKSAPDRPSKFLFPFRDNWDLSAQPNLLEEIAPRLAVAGYSLYRAVFENNCDDGLKEVSKVLQSSLRQKPCCIAITSSDCFLPWGMLYTHPEIDDFDSVNGTNWRKEGFWGYQHIVQQNPDRLRGGMGAGALGAAAMVSVNFDDRLSKEKENGPQIANHLEQIGKLGGPLSINRTKKNELKMGFVKRRAELERILYFYCHRHGSSGGNNWIANPPRLVFSDGDITASDFEDWSQGQQLPTNPFIFINACQGGQMQSMFYQSFAIELLKQGASGLVGAQIDMPSVFASAYGQRVFEHLFKRDSVPVRTGPLLRSINQQMWDTYKHPLGLAYSLYRGMNFFIDWQAMD